MPMMWQGQMFQTSELHSDMKPLWQNSHRSFRLAGMLIKTLRMNEKCNKYRLYCIFSLRFTVHDDFEKFPE